MDFYFCAACFMLTWNGSIDTLFWNTAFTINAISLSACPFYEAPKRTVPAVDCIKRWLKLPVSKRELTWSKTCILVFSQQVLPVYGCRKTTQCWLHFLLNVCFLINRQMMTDHKVVVAAVGSLLVGEWMGVRHMLTSGWKEFHKVPKRTPSPRWRWPWN